MRPGKVRQGHSRGNAKLSTLESDPDDGLAVGQDADGERVELGLERVLAPRREQVARAERRVWRVWPVGATGMAVGGLICLRAERSRARIVCRAGR